MKNTKSVAVLAVVGVLGSIISGCGNSSNKVKSVVLSEGFSAAILEDGSLYTWGNNDKGQLGKGHKEHIASNKKPVKIMDNIASISWDTGGLLADYAFCVALTENGSLYTWGDNSRGQLGRGSTYSNELTPVKIMDNVKSFDLGICSVGAITEDGELYTWGANYNHLLKLGGQIGNGTTEDALEPVKIMDNVKAVDFGSYCAGAITEDGSLYTWGSNYSGEVGNDSYEDCLTPVKIMDDVVEIDFSGSANMALTGNGDLYTWGTNSRVPVCIMSNVKSINSQSAVTNNDELYVWGYNDILEPTKVLDNVETGWCNGAITNDKALYLWGDNYYGQLGNGISGGDYYTHDEDIDSWEPVKVMDNVDSVSFESSHNAAITTDGDLYIWGNNSYGQLGNGKTKDSDTPIKVKFPKK